MERDVLGPRRDGLLRGEPSFHQPPAREGQNSVVAFFSPFLLFWWEVCVVSGKEDNRSAVEAWATTEFCMAIGISV